METSDSECFESADEDFHSDEEPTTVKQINVKEKRNELSPKLEKNKVIISENSTEDNKNANTEQTIVESLSKDDLNNIQEPQETVLSLKLEKCTLQPNPIKETKVIPDQTVKDPETKCEPVNTPKQVDDDRDDDLWDDEELDWGKEEELEKESQVQSSTLTEKHVWGKKKELEEKKNVQSSNITEKVNEDMWENDDWEPVEHSNKEPTNNEEPDNSWAGWTGWGVSSILNSASHSVSTITQGITTAIGVPEPEELARINLNEKEQRKHSKDDQNAEQPRRDEPATNLAFGFGHLGNLVSGVTKLVESTSTKVISGGLDTLETIGKKTMEVLQEGDPGLKKKRAFLQLEKDKPILSQILREAKERADMEHDEKVRENLSSYRTKNYETIFDDYQGLVHLEALEMLSKQCDIKLQTISESLMGDKLTDFQETMEQVRELCEMPSDEEEDESSIDQINEKLQSLVAEINIPITYERLISTWKETEAWLGNLKLGVCSEMELHQQAIETLAQLTAIAVEQFHKGGELLLVKQHRSTADEADSLVQLTTSLTLLIAIVASKFTDKLNEKASEVQQSKDHINALITNVFYESANSSTYIQNAFQLLIPVLQVGAI